MKRITFQLSRIHRYSGQFVRFAPSERIGSNYWSNHRLSNSIAVIDDELLLQNDVDLPAEIRVNSSRSVENADSVIMG